MEKELNFQIALVHKSINDDAYKSEVRQAKLCALVVDRAKAVLQRTQLCTTHNNDENAWCPEGVITLLRLAEVLRGYKTL